MSAVTVQALDNHRRGMIEFHQPGCQHTNRSHNTDFGIRQMEVDEIDAWVAEAKSLGTPAPVAPCLKAAIKAAR